MRVTIQEVQDFKDRSERFPVLTAYDYPTAKIVDEVGIPLILVGDSLGNVVLGYDSTVFVTMEDMLHHTKAVVRGAKRALVIGDMPFMSYQKNPGDALTNAARFLQEAGAQAVKLEGGEVMAETPSREGFRNPRRRVSRGGRNQDSSTLGRVRGVIGWDTKHSVRLNAQPLSRERLRYTSIVSPTCRSSAVVAC